MKLTIDKDSLMTSLGVVSKGMSSRSTLPILSGIYIEAVAGILFFRTTDLEVSIQHTSSALIEEEGSIVVPGKLFTDIVRSFPDAAVSLELKADQLNVCCLDSEFNIHCLMPDDFPSFPQIDSKLAIKIPASTLSSMVKRVVKAVSKDESRAVLTGVYIKNVEDELQMVATDSYRMAITKTKIDGISDQEAVNLIIPGTILEEIRRLAAAGDDVSISESKNQIIFNFTDTVFITRKIDGNYPNFEAIIPSEKNVTATVDKTALLEAVKRIAITAGKHTPIRFKVDNDLQTVDVSSKTQDVASSFEKISAQVDGESLEIGFNPQYIIDGLSVVDSDEVLIEAQTPLKPGIFKSVDGDYFFYLTMPVRIES